MEGLGIRYSNGTHVFKDGGVLATSAVALNTFSKILETRAVALDTFAKMTVKRSGAALYAFSKMMVSLKQVKQRSTLGWIVLQC